MGIDQRTAISAHHFPNFFISSLIFATALSLYTNNILISIYSHAPSENTLSSSYIISKHFLSTRGMYLIFFDGVIFQFLMQMLLWKLNHPKVAISQHVNSIALKLLKASSLHLSVVLRDIKRSTFVKNPEHNIRK